MENSDLNVSLNSNLNVDFNNDLNSDSNNISSNDNDDSVFASGFPEWDLLPPNQVVKRVIRR